LNENTAGEIIAEDLDLLFLKNILKEMAIWKSRI
jgi:hypothetical protein